MSLHDKFRMLRKDSYLKPHQSFFITIKRQYRKNLPTYFIFLFKTFSVYKTIFSEFSKNSYYIV